MTERDTRSVGILGIGTFIPAEIRKNDWWPEETVRKWHSSAGELLPRDHIAEAATPGVRCAREWSAKYTGDPFRGAVERRIMPEAMTPSDMETFAARDALKNAGVSSADVDVMLGSSLVPDALGVNCAAKVHHQLGLRPECPAIVVDAVCNSFITQLVIADRMIGSGSWSLALLVQSAAQSRIVPAEAPYSAHMGDGATAVVVGPVSDGGGVMGSAFLVDGSLHDAFLMGVPGKRWYDDGPVVAYSENRDDCRRMMENAPDYAEKVISDALADAGLNARDVGFFACHQPLPWVLPAVAQHVGLEAAQSVNHHRWTGSLNACNIPLQLAIGGREGMLTDGTLALCFAIATGTTAGAIAIRWASSSDP